MASASTEGGDRGTHPPGAIITSCFVDVAVVSCVPGFAYCMPTLHWVATGPHIRKAKQVDAR